MAHHLQQQPVHLDCRILTNQTNRWCVENMMRQYNLYEAKTQLSQLVQAALDGAHRNDLSNSAISQ